MSVYRFIHAFVSAPLEADVAKPLSDMVTLTPVVLPAGTFVDSVYWKRDDGLVGDATLSMGWEEAPARIVPGNASSNVNVTDLITTNVAFHAIGTQLTPPVDVGMMLTASGDVSAGTIEVLIRCARYLE